MLVVNRPTFVKIASVNEGPLSPWENFVKPLLPLWPKNSWSANVWLLGSIFTMHWMHRKSHRLIFSFIQYKRHMYHDTQKSFMRTKYRFSHVCKAFQQHHIYNICIGSTMMCQAQQPVHPLISPHRTQQHVVPLTALRSGHLGHRVGGFRWNAWSSHRLRTPKSCNPRTKTTGWSSYILWQIKNSSFWWQHS